MTVRELIELLLQFRGEEEVTMEYDGASWDIDTVELIDGMTTNRITGESVHVRHVMIS